MLSSFSGRASPITKDAIIAAEHGKQVILDKPLAVSLEEADRVIDAVERNGVRLIPWAIHKAWTRRSARWQRSLPVARWACLGPSARCSSAIGCTDRAVWRSSIRTGEGLLMRQGPVQADIVRMLGGGLVRSVRATTSGGDPTRPINGGYAAFAEFENGASATMTYSGYGFFDSTELTFGVGLQGYPSDPQTNRRSHELIDSFADRAAEAALRTPAVTTHAPHRPAEQPAERRHAFFGFTLVSCERGDMRQTPTGLVVYSARGREDLPLSAGADWSQRYTTAELDLMYTAC